MKLKAELDGVQAVFQKNIDQIKAYAPRLKASGRYKVFENRLAENLGGLEGRGSGQGNFHRIEILNHTAVFTLIISLISIEKFGIAHFLI